MGLVHVPVLLRLFRLLMVNMMGDSKFFIACSGDCLGESELTAEPGGVGMYTGGTLRLECSVAIGGRWMFVGVLGWSWSSLLLISTS